MEQLLKFLVKSIVQKPKKVRIQKREKEEGKEYLLKVDKEDLKIVIGKKGKTINAIRTLLKLKAKKKGEQAFLSLLEEDHQS